MMKKRMNHTLPIMMITVKKIVRMVSFLCHKHEKRNHTYDFLPDNDDYREENRTYGFFFHAYGIKYLFVKIETVS